MSSSSLLRACPSFSFGTQNRATSPICDRKVAKLPGPTSYEYKKSKLGASNMKYGKFGKASRKMNSNRDFLLRMAGK